MHVNRRLPTDGTVIMVAPDVICFRRRPRARALDALPCPGGGCDRRFQMRRLPLKSLLLFTHFREGCSRLPAGDGAVGTGRSQRPIWDRCVTTAGARFGKTSAHSRTGSRRACLRRRFRKTSARLR